MQNSPAVREGPGPSSSASAATETPPTDRPVESERPKTPRPEEREELPLSEYEKAWRLINSAPASTRRRLQGPSTSTPQNQSSTPPTANSLEHLTLSTNGNFMLNCFRFFLHEDVTEGSCEGALSMVV